MQGALVFGYLGAEEESRVSATDMNSFAERLRPQLARFSRTQ